MGETSNLERAIREHPLRVRSVDSFVRNQLIDILFVTGLRDTRTGKPLHGSIKEEVRWVPERERLTYLCMMRELGIKPGRRYYVLIDPQYGTTETGITFCHEIGHGVYEREERLDLTIAHMAYSIPGEQRDAKRQIRYFHETLIEREAQRFHEARSSYVHATIARFQTFHPLRNAVNGMIKQRDNQRKKVAQALLIEAQAYAERHGFELPPDDILYGDYHAKGCGYLAKINLAIGLFAGAQYYLLEHLLGQDRQTPIRGVLRSTISLTMAARK